jgi:hypothetical protein
MKRLLLAAAAAALFVFPALAQQVPPYIYPLNIGTSSVPILPANPQRKYLLFHNPNDSAKIAVCPVGPTRAVGGSPALIVAAINGAGCISILPYDRYVLDGAAPSGPQRSMGSAWVGIASAPGSALTILELE